MRRSYRSLFSTLAASSTLRWSTSAFSPRQITSRPCHVSLFLSTASTTEQQPSTTSTSTTATTSTTTYENLCLGGDFAGLQAKFSAKDGSLIPVPVHLIPESLLEWGQEPTCLEVLTSEDDSALPLTQRQEITILPETGCGIDNQETMKSETTFDQERATVQWSQPSESTLIFDYKTTTNDDDDDTTITNRRLETQFSLSNAHRIRIAMDLQITAAAAGATDYQIQSPLTMYLERQTNTTSSQGTRADGGGLDGRTVSLLMGDWLRGSYSFAEETKSANPAREWKVKDDADATFNPSSLIHLPGNITLSGGPAVEQDSWILELSHFTADDGSKGSKRILQRVFSGLQFEVDHKEEVGEYVS